MNHSCPCLRLLAAACILAGIFLMNSCEIIVYGGLDHGFATSSPIPGTVLTPRPSVTASPTQSPTASPSESPEPTSTASPSPSASASASPSPTTTSPAGTASLEGSVRIISSTSGTLTQTTLAGITITLRSGSFSQTAASSSDGSYSLGSLAADDSATLSFSLPGYQGCTISDITLASGQTTYAPTAWLIPDKDAKLPGQAGGTITDAYTGLGLSGAAISLYPGIYAGTDSTTLSAQSSSAGTTTASGGTWSISSLEAGIYTALVQKDGYIGASFMVTCLGGTTVTNQNSSISPTLTITGLRAVLDWGASPLDLDLHMSVPGSTSNHVYYYAKGSADTAPWTQLDVDDTDSYGPETITISQVLSGTYTCYVHDYSNRNASTSTGLGSSGATVRIYQGASLLYTFNVPVQAGTLWKVFTFDGSTITPVNTLVYESSAAGVSTRSTPKLPPWEESLFWSLPAKP